MTIYARIVDGFAVDICVTPPELSERFNAEWLARQKFHVAPNDTLHGRVAVVGDDGVVTWGDNPRPRPVEIKPPPDPVNQIADLHAKIQALTDALTAAIPATANTIEISTKPTVS